MPLLKRLRANVAAVKQAIVGPLKILDQGHRIMFGRSCHPAIDLNVKDAVADQLHVIAGG